MSELSLGQRQKALTLCIAQLIAYAYSKGYELTFGDAMRDPRLHGEFGVKAGYGAAKSVHKVRLAVDLNLFVEGKYISSGEHPAYKELGSYWESLHPLARWGGRFNDANHFSFEYMGCK